MKKLFCLLLIGFLITSCDTEINNTSVLIHDDSNFLSEKTKDEIRNFPFAEQVIPVIHITNGLTAENITQEKKRIFKQYKDSLDNFSSRALLIIGDKESSLLTIMLGSSYEFGAKTGGYIYSPAYVNIQLSATKKFDNSVINLIETGNKGCEYAISNGDLLYDAENFIDEITGLLQFFIPSHNSSIYRIILYPVQCPMILFTYLTGSFSWGLFLLAIFFSAGFWYVNRYVQIRIFTKTKLSATAAFVMYKSALSLLILLYFIIFFVGGVAPYLYAQEISIEHLYTLKHLGFSASTLNRLANIDTSASSFVWPFLLLIAYWIGYFAIPHLDVTNALTAPEQRSLLNRNKKYRDIYNYLEKHTGLRVKVSSEDGPFSSIKYSYLKYVITSLGVFILPNVIIKPLLFGMLLYVIINILQYISAFKETKNYSAFKSLEFSFWIFVTALVIPIGVSCGISAGNYFSQKIRFVHRIEKILPTDEQNIVFKESKSVDNIDNIDNSSIIKKGKVEIIDCSYKNDRLALKLYVPENKDYLVEAEFQGEYKFSQHQLLKRESAVDSIQTFNLYAKESDRLIAISVFERAVVAGISPKVSLKNKDGQIEIELVEDSGQKEMYGYKAVVKIKDVQFVFCGASSKSGKKHIVRKYMRIDMDFDEKLKVSLISFETFK
ncbi:MAG: hypothetical protein LBT50_09900 [Prevotellaceae bacterium]|jgi:hypothetical protein|nr:hypothetical protein [Prevotellaceae bacterium]